MCLSGAKGCVLTAHYKDLSSLSSGLLSCNATHSVCRYHLAIFTSSYGFCGSEGQDKNADTLTTATTTAMPASIKMSQANLLTCKSGKKLRAVLPDYTSTKSMEEI